MRARLVLGFLSALAVAIVVPTLRAQAAKTLDVYVIDVEGGNAALYVAPSGESVLIDTGNGGAGAARDADRIMAAVHDAGLKQIDNLIITHYHGDHFGGLPELAKRVPIAHFIDHGPNIQSGAQIDPVSQEYARLYSQAKHTIVKPGDRLQVAGLDWRIVSSNGDLLQTPLPGAGSPNRYCVGFKLQTVNPISGAPVGNTEDEMSVGSHVTFGRFRTLYLGDLTWNKEFDLMCPNNRVGTVDLLVVSRHGQASSNSEALVHAVQPRAIIMNNGIRKGGQPEAMKVFLSAPGLESLWQVHFSQLSGQEYTVPGMFIANLFDEPQPAMQVAPMPPPARGQGQQASPAPSHNGPAYYLKVAARQDGTFTVTNSRNGYSKTY